MTAFIISPYRDRVEILSDGAVYTPDGVVLAASEKVAMSDAVPLAVVGSGAVADIIAVSGAILTVADKTASVDDTLSILASALLDTAQHPQMDTGLRIAIGAISETRGPLCCVFSTFDEPTGIAKAFELQEMPRCFAQGASPSGEELVAYGRPLSIGEGLETDAAFLFESMRRQRLQNPAARERKTIFSVGGHVDLTIVRADGYERRRLLTWPDVVGEKIDPFADQSVAA